MAHVKWGSIALAMVVAITKDVRGIISASSAIKKATRSLQKVMFRPIVQPFLTRRTFTSFRTLAAAMTETSSYKFNHTMLRVKDPQRSVKFYELLGMKLINKLENPDASFDLYFMAYDDPKAANHGKHWTDREGLIELTHNYGTEKDDNYTVNNGNGKENRGFGHVCISVDHIQDACKRISDAGYSFQKRLEDGRMRSIAFALDPDNYWVEIISQNPVSETEGKKSDVATYRMNHTMIRVKDAEKSLKFYQDVMGMTLQRTSEQKEAGFTLYFLSYGPKAPEQSANGVNPIADREGILELTWNHGSESDPNVKYHNGNDEPQGFGHTCVSVDDLDAACKRFEDMKVSWKKRLTDGRMKNVAFILDPDNYWIEVIQNEKLKNRASW
ncbi:lactoylglutathione lyase-like protein [Aureobasidium subglaciale]|nr:lactoylglutathione lyase-like protein [Aureobasidium subglaciale]